MLQKSKILLIFIFIFFLFPLFINAQEDTNFNAIKIKYMDVDINIEIPLSISNYPSDLELTFETPIFYNTETQTVTVSAYYLDENGNKQYTTTIDTDNFGNSIATFKISKVTKSNYSFYINAHIVSQNNFSLKDQSYNLLNPINDFNEYKLPTKNIQSNASEIISLANSIKTSDDALTELVEITNWIHQNIEYDETYGGAIENSLTVLSTRKGVCDEFSVLEAAILRARGFPVKYVTGFANSSKKWEPHAWLEAYVPNQGWLSVDPTYGEVGMLDATHVVLAKMSDPEDIQDVITTFTYNKEKQTDIVFQEKQRSYTIHDFKTFEELGFGNLISFSFDFNKEMRKNSVFEINVLAKNNYSYPIITNIRLDVHPTFKFLYPKSEEQIVYIKPNDTLNLKYYYLLPDINKGMYMIFGIKLYTQIQDIDSNVSVYPDKGEYKQAFLFSEPVIYFAQDNVFFNFEFLNLTTEDKQITIDFNNNGEMISEPKAIPSGNKWTYSRSFTALDNAIIILTITGDYNYSKIINIYPDVQNIIIQENLDSNQGIVSETIPDIPQTNNNDSNLSSSPQPSEPISSTSSENKNSFLLYSLVGVFILLLILFIFTGKKHKKNIGLERV